MKKIVLMGLGVAACLGATAQNNLVKEVERDMKSNPENYQKNIERLKPAFTNPETQNGAYAWFVAGKGGMDYYDKAEGFRAIGKATDDKAAAHALLDAYGYLKTSIQKDTVVNEKGKVKTKYSKDIVKLVQGHYNDVNAAGVMLWGAQDYNGAYDAWELYTSLPFDPIFGANAPAAPADSTLSDIHYNKALAAWQAERLEDALNSFDKALALGYNGKNIYDYAISVAYNMNNSAKMAEYAAKAYPLYGAEDNRYIGYMINDKINNKQYDEAKQMLETYIAADPNNAQLYYVLGILYDSQENAEEATKNYKKAIELDPENAAALMQYGRQIYNSAVKLDDEYNTLNAQEYNQARAEKIDPLLREAAEYLEKAYALDSENMGQAVSLLRSIYYSLNDQENLQRVEAM